MLLFFKSIFSSATNVVLAILGIIIVILSILFFYYKSSAENLAIKYDNLNTQVESLKGSVEKQNKDFLNYQKDINIQYDNIIELNKKSSQYGTDIKQINLVLQKHDLNKISDKKPTLLVKKINNAMKKEINDINEITK